MNRSPFRVLVHLETDAYDARHNAATPCYRVTRNAVLHCQEVVSRASACVGWFALLPTAPPSSVDGGRPARSLSFVSGALFDDER
jgi:hypothetical protein